MASKEEPDKSLATGGMNRSDPTGGSAAMTYHDSHYDEDLDLFDEARTERFPRVRGDGGDRGDRGDRGLRLQKARVHVWMTSEPRLLRPYDGLLGTWGDISPR